MATKANKERTDNRTGRKERENKKNSIFHMKS